MKLKDNGQELKAAFPAAVERGAAAHFRDSQAKRGMKQMSRIGNKPIPLPTGVKYKIEGNTVLVEGPKGKVSALVAKGISLDAAVHGLTRALVNNAVQGVTKGWSKELDIVGIGYRAEMKGKGTVVFTLGYSHPIEFPLPSGIEVAIDPKQTHLTVSGVDRQKVGQVAADMRSLRVPDPYKNKGVRYSQERLKKKAGKTGAK
jgi:large subunit ribosomal protein L6